MKPNVVNNLSLSLQVSFTIVSFNFCSWGNGGKNGMKQGIKKHKEKDGRNMSASNKNTERTNIVLVNEDGMTQKNSKVAKVIVTTGSLPRWQGRPQETWSHHAEHPDLQFHLWFSSENDISDPGGKDVLLFLQGCFLTCQQENVRERWSGTFPLLPFPSSAILAAEKPLTHAGVVGTQSLKK